MSDEHFTVDGTLLEAWASQKSFQRNDGYPDGDGRDFRGHDRKNDTHASTTDPDARLYRKSNHAEARLAYLGHLLMENRHGLIVDAQATVADGLAEREAAIHDAQRDGLRRRGTGPWAPTKPMTRPTVSRRCASRHAPRTSRRTTPAAAGARSMPARRDTPATPRVNVRPRIERAFGWLKTIAGLRKVKLRGLPNVDALFVFASAAYNLKRLSKLLPTAAAGGDGRTDRRGCRTTPRLSERLGSRAPAHAGAIPCRAGGVLQQTPSVPYQWFAT